LSWLSATSHTREYVCNGQEREIRSNYDAVNFHFLGRTLPIMSGSKR
jgi:hypothetical protein